MTLPRFALLATLALAACSGARNPARIPSPTSTPPDAAPAVTEADASLSADGAARAIDPATGLPAEIQLPASGCATDTPSVRNFRADETALEDLPASASAATRTLSEGPVRIDLPAAWFASRTQVSGAVVFRIHTGSDTDVLSLYLGAEPPVRLRAAGARAFRLAPGPVAVRGALWEEETRQRLEAIALLPCAVPRFVHLAAYTDDPLTRARAVFALRSLRIDISTPLAPAAAELVELVPAESRAALMTIAGGDALALSLLTRATTLRSHYPLTEVHPLADQWIFGSFDLTLGGTGASVWARIPVRAGRAETPRSLQIFRENAPAALARELTALVREGCANPSPVFASDGVVVHCAGEPERRALADASDPEGLVAALASLRHARKTLLAWPRTPAVFAPGPGLAALCPPAEARIAREGGSLFVTSDACVVTLDPARERVRSVAIEADCAALEALPAAPWSRALREGLQLAERGAHCRLSLGWSSRGGYAVAAGDNGTASAPIASSSHGPVAAVDRRAVHTALGFMHDLLAYATERESAPPPNARPSVLRSLGLHQPHAPAAVALLTRLERRGGLHGASDTAVLGARALGPSRVEVLFHTLAVELTEEQGGWVVSAASLAEPPQS